jgi:hypothetical protein
MRIALATFAGFVLLSSALWAADKEKLAPAAAPKVNKMSEKMAKMAVSSSLVRSAKMKDRAMLKSEQAAASQVVAPKSEKKTLNDDKTNVKMNKIDDKTSKLMLKRRPGPRRMSEDGPKYADKIQGSQLGVK